MRILMLGWEFPPFIAGGLGTACEGLTRALRRQGHEIMFVLPKPIGEAQAEHVRLFGPDGLRRFLTAPASPPAITRAVFDGLDLPEGDAEEIEVREMVEGVSAVGVPAAFMSPYGGLPAEGSEQARRLSELVKRLRLAGRAGELPPLLGPLEGPGSSEASPDAASADDLFGALESIEELSRGDQQYGSDLFGDANRYARVVAALSVRMDFDVVHAHDWLAYPAGLAVKAVSGKPLVAHVHATEFDRSGHSINQQVYEIERAGMAGADRVIAVSNLTRAIAMNRYGADPEKIDVVYNGVESSSQPDAGSKIASDDKIVLFLGRITMQKGPEYFVRAAKRVLEKVKRVKFVVAGSGDMAARMIEEAAHLGIGQHLLFTGFLRGRDVDRVYRMADCYVMPSVSEPFGIAALEAIQRDVPVIISKQSGVSEVLTHALKVDFWDTDEMANKIVAVLRHPPLSQTLREHGAFEVRRLTWDDAATKTVRTYGRAIASV